MIIFSAAFLNSSLYLLERPVLHCLASRYVCVALLPFSRFSNLSGRGRQHEEQLQVSRVLRGVHGPDLLGVDAGFQKGRRQAKEQVPQRGLRVQEKYRKNVSCW